MFRTKCKEHDHSSFYKLLQMEPTTTNKNNDCYFFYYSTCTKGDSCGFRHEPSALGCEVMCSYWQQGNCLNEHCNFRHMELKKDRKSIACYWENQRGGCKKPHCPFLHSLERAASNETTINNPNKPTSELPSSKPVNQEWSNRQDDGKFDGSGTESDQGRGSSEAGSFIGSPAVDPLIVNFDEESDSEGVANPSPVKSQTTTRVPYCKTYEEIRLEEIQAESAAYYSYEPSNYLKNIAGGKEQNTSSIRTARIATTTGVYSREKAQPIVKSLSSSSSSSSRDLDFKILTLDEIKKRKISAQSTESEINDVELTNKSNTKDNENITLLPEDINKIDSQLKVVSTKKSSIELRKRTLLNRKRELDSNDNNDNKTCMESKKPKMINVTVPPVRLRRSSKRFIQPDTELVQSSMNTEETLNKLVETNDGDDNDDNETTLVQQSLRKTEIEVRLCDSSTSDDISTLNQMSKEPSKTLDEVLDIKSQRVRTTESIDDFKLDRFDDHSNDDDYLDTASDDILKDIDALLTEKTS
ncbi:hypothetical protein PV327_006477 [Microctonus hyperodae]|uniref:C3H1-type domain-containing protein n=1 Tax=Microctonus hyperodae TaxID=165561 RepID=A0AA39F4E1_MICHY|nr:hypothetical protein PV327_006477 [Microctonus hyperodae]